MNSAVNDFILELYRASRRMPHAEFRPWVFDGLRQIVHFDSAFWFRWAAYEDRSHVHAWYLYRQPETLIQEYVEEELWRVDEVYHRTLNGPRGAAVRVSFEEYSSPKMRDFLRRNQQHHIMTIALMQEVPQIAGGMSLYRNKTRSPFSEGDGRELEALAPHVIDAWRENWLMEVVQSARSTKLTEFSLGVLAPDMMLSEAQHNFGALIQIEWPEWHGPWLPEPLHDHFGSGAAGQPWVGAAIAAYHRNQPDGSTLILMRRRHPIDGLPRRKREAALLFASGASQTEVATQLCLSASTVNNYLVDVYRDLAINDKSDLSVLVARLEP
jgi:DNA-binding CsgD family transcriptional regulator